MRSVAASQLQDSWFDPELRLLPVWNFGYLGFIAPPKNMLSGLSMLNSTLGMYRDFFFPSVLGDLCYAYFPNTLRSILISSLLLYYVTTATV